MTQTQSGRNRNPDAEARSSVEMGAEPGARRLRGNLGTFDLSFTALAFNAPLFVVGGFIPVIIAFGNGLGAPATFVAMGAILLIFAAGLNAMAIRMKRPGAFYAYIARGLGRPPGLAGAFIAILTYVALGAGTLSLFAVASGDFFSIVLGITESGPWWIWALLGWAVVILLSLFNVQVSAKVLGVALVLEVLIIAIWNVRIFFEGGPDGSAVPVLGHFFDGSFALAFLFVAMCMTGFESLQVFREETRDPTRTVPRATFVVVIFLAVFYGITTYAYIISEGFGQGLVDGGADPTGTVLSSMERYLGVVAGNVASTLMLTSGFACALAVQNIASRYLYALGRDRVLPAKLGRANSRHGSPMVASTVSGVLILLVILIPALGQLDPITAYTVLLGLGGYGILILWVATSISVFVFFRRNKDETASLWSSTLAPILSLIALGTVLVLATLNLGDLVGNPELANVILVGAGIVAAAGIATALWWRSRDRAVYDSIGQQGE